MPTMKKVATSAVPADGRPRRGWRARARRAAVLAGAASAAITASVLAPAPGGADTHPRVVEVSPAGALVDGQRVTVRWRGFRQGPVAITQCDPRAWDLGARGFCLWDAQVVAETGPGGSGEVTFEVAAGALSPYAMGQPPDPGGWINPVESGAYFYGAVRGPERDQTLPFLERDFPPEADVGFPLVCDGDQPCDLVVTESALRLDRAASARATLGFAASTGARKPSRIGPSCPPGDPADWDSWVAGGEAWPGQAASDWPGRVVTRPRADPTAAWPPRTADPPPTPPKFVLNARGGNAIGPVLDRWSRRLVAGPARVGIERPQADASFSGMEALIKALALGRSKAPAFVATSISADRARDLMVREQRASVEQHSEAVDALRADPDPTAEERAALAEAERDLAQAKADLAALEAFDPARVVHAPVAVTTVGIGFQLRFDATRFTTFPPAAAGSPSDRCPFADRIPDEFVEGDDFVFDYRAFFPPENVGVDAPFLRVPAAWLLSVYASLGEFKGDPPQGANWSSPDIVAANGGLPDGRRVGLVYRGDPSGQGDLVARWLHAMAGADGWRRVWEPFRASVPEPDAAALTKLEGEGTLVTVKAATSATQAVTLLDDSLTWDPPSKEGWTYGTRNKAIGFVDTALARKAGVPLAHIQNAAGRWVAPTEEGALAALAASRIRPDGVVEPNFAASDPAAYPLPQVYYVAFATDAMSAEQRSGVADMLALSLSPEGQRVAREEGIIALPASLRAGADRALKVLRPEPTTVAPTSEGTGSVAAAGAGAGAGGTGGAASGAAGDRDDAATGSEDKTTVSGGAATGASATEASPGAPGAGGVGSRGGRPSTAAGEPEAVPPQGGGEMGVTVEPTGQNRFWPGGIVPRALALIPAPVLAALGAAGAVAAAVARRRLGQPGLGTGPWRRRWRLRRAPGQAT